MKPEPRDTGSLGPGTQRLVDLARLSLGTISMVALAKGHGRLIDRMNARRRATRTAWRFVAVTGAVAAALVVTALRWNSTEGHVAYRVVGAVLESSGVVEAQASSASVLFSEGSEVALHAGSRIRVESVDARGAHLSVERGQMHVRVVHAPSTRWSLDAGPFVVEVTGTAFRIAWDPGQAGGLDVWLENGSVSVRGPTSDAPVSVRAGQHLTVRGGAMLLRPTDSEAPFGETSAADRGPVPPDEPALDTKNARAVPFDAGSRPERGSSGWPASYAAWTGAVARGDFQRVVDEATTEGLSRTLARAGSSELTALADAARYTHNPEVAREALLALRRRFPATEGSRMAAFSLGRLAEAQGEARAALGWYDVYLSQQGHAGYAADALGRKMLLVKLLDGVAAAQPIAEAYLHAFSNGPYAQAARAVLDDP